MKTKEKPGIPNYVGDFEVLKSLWASILSKPWHHLDFQGRFIYFCYFERDTYLIITLFIILFFCYHGCVL